MQGHLCPVFFIPAYKNGVREAFFPDAIAFMHVIILRFSHLSTPLAQIFYFSRIFLSCKPSTYAIYWGQRRNGAQSRNHTQRQKGGQKMNMKDKMHTEELYLQTIRKLRQSSFFALIGSIHSTQPDRPNRTGGRSCCAQCLRKSAATATSNRPFMPIGVANMCISEIRSTQTSI